MQVPPTSEETHPGLFFSVTTTPTPAVTTASPITDAAASDDDTFETEGRGSKLQGNSTLGSTHVAVDLEDGGGEGNSSDVGVGRPMNGSSSDRNATRELDVEVLEGVDPQLISKAAQSQIGTVFSYTIMVVGCIVGVLCCCAAAVMYALCGPHRTVRRSAEVDRVSSARTPRSTARAEDFKQGNDQPGRKAEPVSLRERFSASMRRTPSCPNGADDDPGRIPAGSNSNIDVDPTATARPPVLRVTTFKSAADSDVDCHSEIMSTTDASSCILAGTDAAAGFDQTDTHLFPDPMSETESDSGGGPGCRTLVLAAAELQTDEQQETDGVAVKGKGP